MDTFGVKGLGRSSDYSWLLKRVLELSIFTWFYSLQSFYMTTPSTKNILTMDNLHNLQTLHQGLRSFFQPRRYLYLIFALFVQNSNLKVFMKCIRGKSAEVAFQFLLALKKGTRNSDFQSNEPSPKFIRPPLPLKPYALRKDNWHNIKPLPQDLFKFFSTPET